MNTTTKRSIAAAGIVVGAALTTTAPVAAAAETVPAAVTVAAEAVQAAVTVSPADTAVLTAQPATTNGYGWRWG